MSIRSMTGFGHAEGSSQGWAFKVELKAVNHKALDVRVNAPRDWSWVEPVALGLIKQSLKRGRVSVSVDVRREVAEGSAGVSIDEAAFAAVVGQLEHLAKMNGLAPDVRLSEVLAFRSRFELSDAATLPEDHEPFVGVLADAISNFDQTRVEEGATILAFYGEQLDHLDATLARIIELRPKLLEDYRERLIARLTELGKAHGLDLEQERIIQEVIHFGDRTDIAEECQRAGAHLVRLRELIVEPDGPHGKKLDFYLQEMIRETNTMASKSNFSDMTALVVDMKTRIEQMREQAANVE